MLAAVPTDPSPHVPVLLDSLLAAVAPVTGRWLDGTFGAGGYTRGLLDAGADQVIAVDRDPAVFDMAASLGRGIRRPDRDAAGRVLAHG